MRYCTARGPAPHETSGLSHADQASVVPAFTAFFDMMNPVP
jgi:hypothetical protein